MSAKKKTRPAATGSGAEGELPQGVKLLRRCYELLERAERRIELLSGVDAEGNPITTPLDDSSLSLDEKARNRGRRRSATLPEKPAKPDEVDDDTDMDRSGELF